MKRQLKSQFGKNVLAGPLSTAANIVVTLFSYRLYVRYLGYEGLGVWLLLSSVLAFVQLTNLGLGPALTSLVAEARERQDHLALKGYYSTAFAALGALGTLGVLVTVLVGHLALAGAHLTADSMELATKYLPFAGALSLTAFLGQASTATLSGLGRLDLANYVDTGSRVVGFALSFLLLRLGYGLEAPLAGAGLTQCLIIVVIHVTIRALLNGSAWDCAHVRTVWFQQLWSRARGLLWGSAATLLIHPLNRLAVARWSGVEMVPVFDIAYSGAMQLRTIFEAGGRAIAPQTSFLAASGRRDAYASIRSILRRTSILVAGASLPVMVFCGVFSDFFLRAWLGNGFRPEITPVFRVFIGVAYVSLIAVPPFYISIGLGRTGVVAKGQTLLASLNFLLVFSSGLLIGETRPIHFALALAVATCVSTYFYMRSCLSGLTALERGLAVVPSEVRSR